MLKIHFICIANYCRSPAAEKIFNHLSPNNMISSSSGIHPFNQPKMDERTCKFLNHIGIVENYHVPSEFNEKKFNESDLIILFDIKILLHLQKKFKNINSKAKIYNAINQNLNIRDPYKIKKESDYFIEMEKIHTIVKEWIKHLK